MAIRLGWGAASGLAALAMLGLGCGDGGASDGTDGAQTDGSSTEGADASSGSQSAGSDPSTSGSPTDSDSNSDSNSDSAPTTTGDTATTDPTDTVTTTDPSGSSSSSSTSGTPSDCDYQSVDSMIVIEAESLPIVEDWGIDTTEAGYYADGYIEWTGTSHNNDPTHGLMDVTIHVDTPGRYRLQWRNRIGEGTNTTEHNDSWVTFSDAADYYGLQLDGADERRRYPRPQCEDPKFIAEIEALPEVIEVECVEGSSVDGWFKVYSSGASDWSWSTRTNDNNAFNVMIEFDAAGDYTFSMAARADHHLLDRIVIHEETLEDAVVHDENATETTCR